MNETKIRTHLILNNLRKGVLHGNKKKWMIIYYRTHKTCTIQEAIYLYNKEKPENSKCYILLYFVDPHACQQYLFITGKLTSNKQKNLSHL